MSSLNLVVIEGHINKVDYDRVNDDSICKLYVKANRFSPDNDKPIEEVFRVDVYSRLADICNRYLDKGSHVLISGCLSGKNIIIGRDVKFLPSAQKVKAI